ncbi:MAG TPA: DUF5947 family protein [Stellaceae bacterium]|nr:DUF5947 family protein [Stellaceae bacterium]
MLTAAPPRHAVAALRRFVRAQPVESCELCGTPIAADHPHVLEIANRRLLCACRVCGDAMAMRPGEAYRLVPRTVAALPAFQISDAEWAMLDLPIDMAFLLHSSPAQRPIALYPGPTGIAESHPSTAAWSALAMRNPVLSELQPDVEALLVNRIKGRRAYFRAPIDRCFHLAGLLRTRWQGWSGGDAVWQAVDDFFAVLAAEARTPERGRAA